jgi:hypothetical protein
VHILKAGIPIVAIALACTSAAAQEPSDPFDVLPSHHLQALTQLAALDDAQFRNAVFENNGERFRAIVASFDPPDSSIFPVSHGFAGPKEACLGDRIIEACRLYVMDLHTVQQRKQPANSSVTNNPFDVPAR